ncbi:hypothetical protein TSTA_065610 [Talaromyces stipitatus ATCC 10500]|uniref:Uncharacterized protein n=1 Tax=Talaromyces stipitatus (strain ATCC 10500 / CBS 375.48 / QM 6759 / NRRL 1006) TaxID=441959 RepID=B8LV56_TALSN|nr:uncharacterized protein TSTA_065610 [Talaromyces stipitatus ATCC 10500]EED23106.1 hypothetical protein TSTA_065610 [Talaromyces stipitatus ATCC 10500]
MEPFSIRIFQQQLHYQQLLLRQNNMRPLESTPLCGQSSRKPNLLCIQCCRRNNAPRTTVSNPLLPEGTPLSFVNKRTENTEIERDYRPRRRTTTELLSICQTIYHETWIMPFILAEHVFNVCGFEWTTNCDEYPGRHLSRERMALYPRQLKNYAITHNTTLHIHPVKGIQIYYRQFDLKRGEYRRLNRAIHIPEQLGPEYVTVSLNFRVCSSSHSLGILSADWVNEIDFPNSVKCVRMDFGKFHDVDRVEEITSKVIENWFFRREESTERPRSEDLFCDVMASYSFFRMKHYVIPTVTWKLTESFNPFVDNYKCPDLDFTNRLPQ